mgnify:CR=1 FL=1
MHDMVRFCHEQSVSEMFSLVGRGGRGLGKARRLTTSLPLVMYVLDLGGGLSPESGDNGPVHAGHLTCRPLQPLWAGMTDGRIAWDHSQLHVDWEEFFSDKSGHVLVIGNPPWVTNSALGALGGNNLPEKTNFQRLGGFAAKIEQVSSRSVDQ